MRIHNIIIAALAAPLLLAGCQKELIVDSGLDKGIHEIAVRTVSGSSLATKSGVSGTTFPAGYDMVVSAYRNNDASIAPDDASKNYFEGVKFSKSDAVWHAATPKYWPLTGSLDFLAIAGSGLNTAANGVVPTFVWNSDNVAGSVVATIPDNSAKFDDILFGGSNAQTYMASGNPIVFRHAESAVVFTASSNVAYDATTNVGVTIDSISVHGAKFSGTLTVTNPAAGMSEAKDSVVAAWSDLGSEKAYIKARVWNTANTGVDTAESVLTALNLTATSASLADKPFGEGYVILPEQDAVPFTITYTIHNGKDASGANVNNKKQYRYVPSAGSKWEQGKKHVYDIIMNLSEITISPSVVDWDSGYTFELIGDISSSAVAQYAMTATASQEVSLPAMTLAEGTKGQIDWGDGSKENFSNEGVTTRSSVSENVLTPSHTYAEDFEGTVKVYLVSGSIESILGPDEYDEYDKYTVLDGENFVLKKLLSLSFASNNTDKGTVSGDESVLEGEEVTLTATPEEGYQCIFWKDESGNVVSNTAEFTFEASEETAARQYKAFFVRNYTANELQGAFTVNADGKMVAFAKGNLYANVVFGSEDQSVVAQSITSYGIEAEQWHYRLWNNGVDADKLDVDMYSGDAAMLGEAASETPAGTVGLFFWTNNALEACSRVYVDDDAAEDDVFFASEVSINGQNMGCLSSSEWDYLLNTRPGDRFAKAFVNDIKGLLIFPDGWEDPGLNIKAKNNASVKYTGTKKKSPATRAGGTTYNVSRLSLTDFATLQDQGVVFLPASGYRYDYVLYYVGSDGHYLSGTPSGGSEAYYMSFYDSSLDASDYGSRRFGQSVRPIAEL